MLGLSGCPDNCVLEMRGHTARVTSATTITQKVGGRTFARTAADLKAGLPLKVKGTYSNGSVLVKTIFIKDRLKMVSTIASIKGNDLKIALGSTEVAFTIPYYQGIVFGSPKAGQRVLVFGNVTRDLSAPFIATRVQPVD